MEGKTQQTAAAMAGMSERSRTEVAGPKRWGPALSGYTGSQSSSIRLGISE